MQRKSFSIHADFYGELRRLNIEQRGNILLALVDWADGDVLPALDPEGAMLFRLMKAQIERISSANSANGSKGGRPSKSEKSEAKPKKPTVSNTVSVTVTDTISKKNVFGHASVAADILPQGFDLFWTSYPKRVKKQDAIKAWRQVNATDHIDVIMHTLDQFIRSPDWVKDNGQYIPHPASWLRGRRWEDETMPSTTSGNIFFDMLKSEGADVPL